MAHGLAAAAHDALVRVADDGRRVFLRILGLLALVGDVADTHVRSQGLELAMAALRALETVIGVVAEHELKDGPTRVERPERIGLHDHVRHAFGDAGRGQIPAADHFHHAHAASAGAVFKGEAVQFEMAEGRNLDTHLLGSFENGRTARHFHFPVVYSQFDRIHCYSSLI